MLEVSRPVKIKSGRTSGSPKGIQAAEQLRLEILSGRLPVGSRLRQVELAGRFGISQIPLREAMRQLQDEGLIRILPYAGAVVAPLVPEEILEAAHIRILLECEALDLAWPRHTPATLARARQALERGRKAGTAFARYTCMRDFLEALYAPAQRPMLLEVILGLYRRSQLTVTIQAELLTRMDPGIPMPATILEHLQAGRPEEAKGCLRLLYRQAAIHGAALLYERQILAAPAPRRPLGRPRKPAPK